MSMGKVVLDPQAASQKRSVAATEGRWRPFTWNIQLTNLCLPSLFTVAFIVSNNRAWFFMRVCRWLLYLSAEMECFVLKELDDAKRRYAF
ncbi:hypothetical protein TNCT_514351 [Trichonephila clavata]|uniref:Uncharacterized protein n=1 Tax=Trichonephila clavata TaxID=2740835 RepID=A0A8X6H4X8_TRICU|nr:hypothetical protein TNCT_514351 [Trichonephila clavata]